jgi:hypothetical protein
VAQAVSFVEANGCEYPATLAVVAGYRERVGFDTSAGRWLYTRRVTYRADQHHAERLVRLAVGDDAAVAREALTPSLYPSSADQESVESLQRQAQLKGAA